MKAHLRTIRISPKKMNLVADLVRGKDVTAAISTLQFTPKRGALPLSKLIKSATANAERTEKAHAHDLAIDQVIVNAGPTLKRARFGSRGRTKPIKKRTTHVTVLLKSSR